MSTSKLVVVTPQRQVLMEEVESVTARGSEGYLGILPRHAPFLTALKPGVLYYRKAGGKTERMAISGGFLKQVPNMVIILADAAEHSSEIDVGRARQAKESRKTPEGASSRPGYPGPKTLCKGASAG